jgi:hypothetical protein
MPPTTQQVLDGLDEMQRAPIPVGWQSIAKESNMWPTHVYRTPSKPLPKWQFAVMFWLIMPAAIVAMMVRRA